MRSEMMTVFGLGALAFASMVLLSGKPKAEERRPEDQPALMRAKLACSEKIVEGLVAEDFDLIRAGAEQLVKITDATDWEANEDQIYAHYRQELRRTALKLSLLAEEKNLDGAAFTYMHSLTTCISCHSHCRDVLHLANEPDLKAIPKGTADAAPKKLVR